MQIILDVAAELFHPIVTPDDPQAWMHARIRGDIVTWREGTTDLGWPVVIVETDRAVHAFYRLFHFLAGAIVHADDADALLRPRFDLRGETPVVLAELWT